MTDQKFPQESMESPHHQKTKSVNQVKQERLLSNRHMTLPERLTDTDTRLGTAELMSRHQEEEAVFTSTSKTGRKVILIRHTMYGNFLQQSTKKLQDDLRQTMKSYSSEKQQLLQHLASLRHEMDELRLSGSESPTSTGSITDLSTASGASNKSKSRRFYHAPNIAAHKLKKSRKKMSKHSKRKSETSDEKKQVEGILKLPMIKEGNFGNLAPLTWTQKNSEWDSAQQITLNNLPPINPPKAINAAEELLQNNYDMPKIEDPERSDKTIPAKGKSQEKKRVKFSFKNQVATISGDNTDIQNEDSDSDGDSKKSHVSSELKLKPKGVNQRQHYLPPLDLGNRRCLNPKETENHKMLYISIKDPDVRRKTLSEILHAVRMRMQENEHHLRFGEMPRRNRQSSSQESPLNSSQESLYSTDSNRSKTSHPGVPQNTAYRMHRRSSNSQLQSYLRKMSRSRRMIEHMEVEEYRLAHIMGHKELMAVSRQATNPTAA